MTDNTNSVTLKVAKTVYAEVTLDLPRYYQHDLSGDDIYARENIVFGKITRDKVVMLHFREGSSPGSMSVQLEVDSDGLQRYGTYLTDPWYSATEADWNAAVECFRRVAEEPI